MQNKTIFTLLLLVLLCATRIVAQTSELHQRVKVRLDAMHTIEMLAALGVETDHGQYQAGKAFTSEFSLREVTRIKAAGFETLMIIPDLKAHFLSGSGVDERSGCGTEKVYDYVTPTNYKPGTYGGYFTYQEMLDILDQMRTKYPNLITARAIITDTIVTHQGRPLYWVKLSDNPTQDEATEPKVLYTALHHAREPNSLSQMLFYMWYLLENYQTDPEIKYIVDNIQLYFVPCINPDGYLINEATDPLGGGFWRKNMRDNLDGSFGVDLNRNYGYQWGYDTIGSSQAPASNIYRGPAPFSEPETRMMRTFCDSHQFKFALNYHTFSNLLIYPWAWSDEVADTSFIYYAKALTRENDYKAGTATETVGYQVNGSSDDYMYGARNIISMTPEVGPQRTGFWPPAADIDGLNKAALVTNKLMAQLPLKLALAEDVVPSVTGLAGRLDFLLTRYGLALGDYTVSVIPASPLVSNVTTAPKTVTLTQFERKAQQFDFTISSAVKVGDTLRLSILVNNGVFTRSEPVVFVYGNPFIPIWNNPMTSFAGWQSQNTAYWNLTPEHFYSAPTSCTDTPNGDYADDVNVRTRISTGIAIPASAKSATLRYYARWELEEGFDYVTIEVGDSPQSMEPQCATGTGITVAFVPTTPVYSGYNTTWSTECVDLGPWIGQSVFFGFRIVSDGFVTYDGFYFDDVAIEYVMPTGTETVATNGFGSMTISPNPAEKQTTIAWRTDSGQHAQEIRIYDMAGRLVRQIAIADSVLPSLPVDVSALPSGAYRVVVQFVEGGKLSGSLQVK